MSISIYSVHNFQVNVIEEESIFVWWQQLNFADLQNDAVHLMCV